MVVLAVTTWDLAAAGAGRSWAWRLGFPLLIGRGNTVHLEGGIEEGGSQLDWVRIEGFQFGGRIA